jgi:hypothetical protein
MSCVILRLFQPVFYEGKELAVVPRRMKARDWPPHMSSCIQLNLARLRIRTRITLEGLIELLKINKAQTFISANAWAHIYAAEVEQSQPGIEAFVGERIRDIPYLFGVDVRPDRPERFRRIVRLPWVSMLRMERERAEGRLAHVPDSKRRIRGKPVSVPDPTRCDSIEMDELL